MDDLTSVIGVNLSQIRHKRGLTLDKLAETSGVSKAMIGQIERGESNPTVNTLWKLAAGLHVSFGKLINTGRPPVKVVRLCELAPIKDDDNGMTLYHLFSNDQDNQFEVFSVVLAPRCVHQAAPHQENSEEYDLITEGNVIIDIGPETLELAPGDAIRFKADKPHTYYNHTDKPVRFQSILYYD